MDKRSKFALYSIGFIILLLMFAEVSKPKAINWRDSYSAADKIPLGCYVLFQELQDLTNNSLETSSKSLYETLKQVPDSTNSTILLINNYISLESEGVDALMEFVEKGNSVFISASYFYGELADTLNIEFDRNYEGFLKSPSHNTFSNPKLSKNNTFFKDVIENNFITSIDTVNSVVLGYYWDEDKEYSEVNFIKTSIGDNGGAFYIHSNPFAFTNYHMLDGKSDYVATVLSYLPTNNIIWDNYYKSGRKIVTSPLRFILSNDALRWAFYISLLSLILFVIFKGKRTQRIIPVVEPLKNATVDFTRTIGDLYFQHGDYSNIINKKITYFLEHIRSHYYLETHEFSERFIQNLSVKSGNALPETKSLIDYITYLKSKSRHTEKELIELNEKIEKFLIK
ncbi:hypothetical protein C1T31_12825 [Hanstruepera neustonica]|uniref:DUF4350 domain-containing protein n=1 Tax=Hanstruepera neustonica TaxID=1445657 RepID=A0A2K1DW15_9FLAO|nr:DUF4350 domain-containing protein [Hanstruepera neustonica]PNQ72203.1 hypothetical protein C1T31_12825 [Hanstruepera neustonica]